MTTIHTPEEAVRCFFDYRGDDLIENYDVEEAISEIGNPSANLPITKTAETVDDFRASGWQDYKLDGPAVILKKGAAWALIVNTGDHRLVYVD